MPFNIFLLRYTVFYWVVDWLGLEVPWFPWCRNSRRNQFSFHQNVFMLSWIFPGRKWFFGVTFVVFWSNNLTANVMFKFFFSHWNQQSIRVNNFKNECDERNIYFVLLWILKHLVLLSGKKELLGAIFKNWINL